MAERKTTARIDVTKPVYIFLLRLTPPLVDESNDAQDVCDVITSYLASLETSALPQEAGATSDNNTTLAIRGSTLPFGTWSNPKVAVRIAKGWLKDINTGVLIH